MVEQESIKSREIMPIALSSVNAVPQPLQTAALVASTGNNGARLGEQNQVAADKSNESKKSAAIGKDPVQEAPPTEKITLSSSNEPASAIYIPAAPYAEIWKDGRKIAEINVRGEVSAVDGFGGMPSIGGGGLSSAALRAALYARSVGGEIRVAGMVTDPSTLTMRAKLQESYGS